MVFSFTSTVTITWLSSWPGLKFISTVSKKPSAVTRSLLLRIPLPLKRSPSYTRSSRRMTVSRVLVLPAISIRSIVCSLPFCTRKVERHRFVPGD